MNASVLCPKCNRGRLEGEGLVVCGARGCVVEVRRFAPVVNVSAAGEVGRCSRHPTKPGVGDCTRCGAFVCDVCVTRTGEQVFCPACFEALHGRGELRTTRTSRFRPDLLAIQLFVLGLFCWGATVPVAFGLAIYGLRRRRQDPWLSKPTLVTALVLSSLAMVAGVLAIIGAVVAASGGGD